MDRMFNPVSDKTPAVAIRRRRAEGKCLVAYEKPDAKIWCIVLDIRPNITDSKQPLPREGGTTNKESQPRSETRLCKINFD